MKTVSLVGSVSRRAGGLFESVRRLDQELVRTPLFPMDQQGDAAPTGRSTNIEVSVLGIQDDCTALDGASWFPLPVHAFRCCGPRCFAYAPGLVRELTRIGPALVHVHGLWQFTSVAALHWHERFRRPYVVSAHGMLDPWALRHSPWKKRLGWVGYEKRHLESASCIRALCGAEANAVRALGLSRPICIIPNGVDLSASVNPSEFGPYGFKGLGLTGRKVLLYLGRLHPKKGLMALLRAWARVEHDANDWVLVIAGWDQNNHEQQLKQLTRELALRTLDAKALGSAEPSVCFIGPQFGPQKLRWLSRCDAFILPSLSEGLPMAVLEAWASAKPVLMSNECNLPEGFAAGAAIRLEAEPGSIASSLSLLFSSSNSVLHDMGSRGRALVATHYTWSKAAAELRQVYAWVLGAGPKPGCVLAP